MRFIHATMCVNVLKHEALQLPSLLPGQDVEVSCILSATADIVEYTERNRKATKTTTVVTTICVRSSLNEEDSV